MSTPLISRVAVRRRILEVCARERPHLGILRVSESALLRIEAAIERQILNMVLEHPSKGVTFNP